MRLETCLVHYSMPKKSIGGLKNCQNNGTCGTALNGIIPSALLMLCKSPPMDLKKNPQRNPQCGPQLPALRNAMLLPRQRTAQRRTVQAQGGAVSQIPSTDMERTKTHHHVHFSNKVHKDVRFCVANLQHCLLAGAETPSIWQSWHSKVDIFTLQPL